MKQCFKVLPLAGAIGAIMLSASVMAAEAVEETATASMIEETVANPTDILTDGWTVNGYIRTGWRINPDGVSTENEFSKANYNTAGTTGKSANQVEFVLGKMTELQNGVWSELGIRAEYGNGNSYFYSSPGSENTSDDGQFEVKEAFIKLGGMDYLPENSHIWAGRRYLNRSSGLLSGEFWKQSSGVGFGYEQAGNGVALISADPGAQDEKDTIVADLGGRATMHSLDLYSYGHEALGGSFDFDLKLMQQGNKDLFKQTYGDDAATDGIGAAITYNRDYYGFDGWTQTAIAYGTGMAANRGVNFGSWSGQKGGGAADNEDARTLFATSYGMLNINDDWQMGSEITYLYGKNIWGLTGNGNERVDRLLIAARPTLRVNDNFRWEWTGAYGYQSDYWSGSKQTANYYTAEIAGVFTVNADYFGRPQIKPFVTYLYKDASDGSGWGDDYGSKKGAFQFGVEAEIWF